MGAIYVRDILMRYLEMQAETCVGLHVNILVVGVLVRFVIRHLKWLILGLNLLNIDLSVPKFPQEGRQTDTQKYIKSNRGILQPPPSCFKSKHKI